MSRTAVLVLMGGPDAEREVSLCSGAEVAAALRATGRYRVVEETIGAVTPEDLDELSAASGADVIFPVLHGRWGEGGALQEAIETIGRPYVGSRPRAAALAMDKLATKRIMTAEGVATPAAQPLDPGEPCGLGPPLVLKPIDDGSSVDLRLCESEAEVTAGRTALHPIRGRLLAERLIHGRELTVGIIGGEALPLIEIRPAVTFYDYAAKYERDDTAYVVDPALPPGVAERCRDVARLCFRTLGCRDVARIDFMLDADGPWFLELNTMPGFTTHSLVPMAARAMGLEMPELCGRLVDTARDRGAAPSPEGGRIKGGGEAPPPILNTEDPISRCTGSV